MKNKTITFAVIAIMNCCLAIAMINAFAVSSSYYQGNPLTVYPGETKEIQIYLQNFAGGENITAKATISSGSEIFKITNPEEVYSIPLGTKTPINLRVSIPYDASIGKTYPVEITFLTQASGAGGTLGFGSGVSQKFDVVVVDRPAPIAPETTPEPTTPVQTEVRTQGPSTGIIIFLVILVLIVIIAAIIMMKRKAHHQKAKKRKK